MIKRLLLLPAIAIGLMAGSACDGRMAKLSDAKIQELRRNLPGITNECIEKVRFGGVEALPQQTQDCFEMMPPQHFRGLWRDNFEGSRFCPEPSRTCSYDTSGDEIWLTMSAGAGEPERKMVGNLYSIEFRGRRTKVPGSYGHLGMSRHEVLVDKIVSIAAVPRSPN